MFPLLLSVGSVYLKTVYLFFALAVFVGGMVFWKKGKEEHYDEFLLLDGYLQAGFVGVIGAKIGFWLLLAAKANWYPESWGALLQTSGFLGVSGIVAGSWWIVRFSKKQKWDAFELLDYWTVSLVASVSILWVGFLFDGTGYGNPTSVPWGMTFAGVFEKHHPVQLYAAVLYMVLWWILSKLEYVYRTFEWYKSRKKSAQTGFLVSIGLLGHAVIGLLLKPFLPPQYLLMNVVIDSWLYIGIAIMSLCLLWLRSGRKLFLWRLS